ncbi:MAG: hypothetical protein ABR907_09930 [Terracidiphilus sp.]
MTTLKVEATLVRLPTWSRVQVALAWFWVGLAPILVDFRGRADFGKKRGGF